MSNTNKLIRAYKGCDAGKTGFTNEAMFCLSASASRDGMRLISVVIGAENSKLRFAEVSKLFNHGFANYENKKVVSKGFRYPAPVRVKNGKEKDLYYKTSADYRVFGKKGEKADIGIFEEIDGVCAPVKAGDVVGRVKITRAGKEIGAVDLVADNDINKSKYSDLVLEFAKRW